MCRKSKAATLAMIALSRKSCPVSALPIDERKAVASVLAISRDYQKELSLKWHQSGSLINPVHLGQLIKRETNATFAELLNKQRIKAAQQLRPMTVLKISAINGYSNGLFLFSVNSVENRLKPIALQVMTEHWRYKRLRRFCPLSFYKPLYLWSSITSSSKPIHFLDLRETEEVIARSAWASFTGELNSCEANSFLMRGSGLQCPKFWLENSRQLIHNSKDYLSDEKRRSPLLKTRHRN